MKIALTVWEDRISPVFDVANTLLLAEIANGEVLNRQFAAFNPVISSRLAEMLKQMGISVLICGAISEVPANIIAVNGIELIPFISGNADRVIDSFAKGKPIIPAFSMPGCGKQCRRHGKKNNYFAQQKEAKNMPKGDRTGPQGQGPGSGKGRGGCKTGKGGNAGQGKGRGSGQGSGRGSGQGSGRGSGQGR